MKIMVFTLLISILQLGQAKAKDNAKVKVKVKVSAAKRPVKIETAKQYSHNIKKNFKDHTLCNLSGDGVKKNPRSLTINCVKGSSAHISHQSLVKKPVYKIHFKIPLKDKSGFSHGDFDFIVEKSDCTNIKCFNELDIKKQLLFENPNLYELLENMTKEQLDTTVQDKIEFTSELNRAFVNNYSPIFSQPINELITNQMDIDAQDSYRGNLIQEVQGDGEPKISIDLLPPDEEYISRFLTEIPSEEEYIALEKEMNENPAFSEEEIAAFEDEFNGAVPDQSLAGSSLEQLNNDVQFIIAHMDKKNNLLKNNDNTTIQNLNDTPSIDEGNDLRDTNATPEDKSFELKFGDKKFKITHNGSHDEKDQFTISDGTHYQKFNTTEFSTLSPDFITDLSFQDGKITYKLLGFDESLPMDASQASKYLSHKDPEKKENTDLSKCLTSLNDFVHNKGYSEAKIQKFLNLQGKLTLHRLAWAHLNKADTKDKLENHILKLIKEKYSKDNAEIANQFDSMNLKSRNFLAKGLPLVLDVIYKQQEDESLESKPYKIHKSDITFLEMVSEFEQSRNSTYDHRQFDTKNISNNITNFTTIINSSYQNSSNRLKDQNDILKNQNVLLSEIKKHQEELNLMIKGFIYESCFEPKGLSCGQATEQVETLFEREANIIVPALIKSISTTKDEDYLEDIRFRKLWLKVAK